MFTLNLEKAKEIWLNKYRIARTPLLEKLDTQFMRALEQNNTELMESIKRVFDHNNILNPGKIFPDEL